MRTVKLAHERADEDLETKRTLSTSPSSSCALTLTLTLHPHPHARAQVSLCASFWIPRICMYIILLYLNNEVCDVSRRFFVMDELCPCDRKSKLMLHDYLRNHIDIFFYIIQQEIAWRKRKKRCRKWRYF